MQDDYTTAPTEAQVRFIRSMQAHKAQNTRIIAALTAAGDDYHDHMADDIDHCATTVGLDVMSDGTVRVSRADFCRRRLCAVCSWRRQAKFVATTYPTLDALAAAGYRYVFATLTAASVRSLDLPGALDDMLAAYTRLMRYKALRGVVGYVRSLEVTYNRSAETWHPHIHALLVVDAAYFGAGSGTYITQRTLQTAWRKALRATYDPVIDIRALRAQEGRKPYIETLKYALKPADIPGPELVALSDALRGRRLVCFGGIVARLRSLDLDDLTDASIDATPGVSITRQVLYKINTTGGTYDIVESYTIPNRRHGHDKEI